MEHIYKAVIPLWNKELFGYQADYARLTVSSLACFLVNPVTANVSLDTKFYSVVVVMKNKFVVQRYQQLMDLIGWVVQVQQSKYVVTYKIKCMSDGIDVEKHYM